MRWSYKHFGSYDPSPPFFEQSCFLSHSSHSHRVSAWDICHLQSQNFFQSLQFEISHSETFSTYLSTPLALVTRNWKLINIHWELRSINPATFHHFTTLMLPLLLQVASILMDWWPIIIPWKEKIKEMKKRKEDEVEKKEERKEGRKVILHLLHLFT